MQRNNLNGVLLFLIGTFATTEVQVIGWIGISEIPIFIFAPVLCYLNWSLLKKHGFTIFILLSWLWIVGGAISSWANSTPFNDAAKGMATPYAVFAIAVVLHHLLHKNLSNVKWLFLGLAVSALISIFVFQPGNYRVTRGEILSGSEASSQVITYSLFWVMILGHWLNLPIRMAYLRTPLWYTFGVTSFLAVFSLVQAGGRSAFAMSAVSLVILLIGRKSCYSMLNIRRAFYLLCTLGVMFTVLLKGAYVFAVTQGYMGEEQLDKYEVQTRQGSGLLDLIIGGRAEVFVGLFAIAEKPIVGYGAWAIDRYGFWPEFLAKHGTSEDFESAYKSESAGMLNRIPAHSQIINAWLWCGVFGLLFWLYIIRLFYVTLRRNMAVVPEWFGFLAISLPKAMWALFFSPFGHRVGSVLLFIICIFINSIAKGKLVYVGSKTI